MKFLFLLVVTVLFIAFVPAAAAAPAEVPDVTNQITVMVTTMGTATPAMVAVIPTTTTHIFAIMAKPLNTLITMTTARPVGQRYHQCVGTTGDAHFNPNITDANTVATSHRPLRVCPL